MKKYIILFYITLLSCLAFSQTTAYRLQIFDETKKPLPGAAIVWDGGGITTDLQGVAQILGEMGSVLPVKISFVGYKTVQKNIIIQAQQKPEQIFLSLNATSLNPVVISAGRYEQPINEVTVSMDVIQPQALNRNNSVNADDALDRAPGVNIALGQANIRGGSGFSYGAGSRVLVLVDDLPLLSADANDVKWNFIPIENMAQVEVIKGASSALFGSSALGGVIHFRTDYPGDTAVTKINFFQGVFNAPPPQFQNPHPNRPALTTGFSGSHSQKFKNLDFVTGFNLLRDEGYRAAEYTQRARINVNTRYRFKDTRFQAGLNLNYMVDSAGLFLLWDSKNGAFFPDSAGSNSRQLAHRFTVDPYFSYFSKNGFKHTFRNRVFVTNNQSSADQGSKGTAIFSQYQVSKSYNWPWARKTNLSAGYAHQLNLIDGGSLYGKRQSLNHAFFAQIDQTIGRLAYSLGGRYEWFSIDAEKPYTYPLIRAGLNYQVLEGTFFRTSFGQGFRAPSVAERYANAQAGAIRIFPNPTLNAENGWSAELGAKQVFEAGKWQAFVDVAAFLTRYFNMVEFTFGAFLPDTPITNIFDFIGFKALNITDAQIKGIEFSSGFRYQNKDLLVEGLAGYTLIDPRDMNDFNTETSFLKYRSKHLWRADLQANYKKWGAGFNLRFNSFMRNIDDFFRDAIPGVRDFREQFAHGDLILDVRTNYKINSNINMTFIIRNLTNRPYMIVPANMGPQQQFVFQINTVF